MFSIYQMFFLTSLYTCIEKPLKIEKPFLFKLEKSGPAIIIPCSA